MSEINVIHPHNFGWLEKKLSSEEIKHIWQCIDARGERVNNILAGNIEISNEIIDKDDWFWINTLNPLCHEYDKQFGNLGMTAPINESRPYFLDGFWVNYQNQNEFNPPHTHRGVYSFVIWIKIPTNHKEQNKLPISANSNEDVISAFQFSYTNILGKIQTFNYEMSPEMEGTMLFFPAHLCHQVFPFFNCDKQRISVSGNILIKV